MPVSPVWLRNKVALVGELAVPCTCNPLQQGRIPAPGGALYRLTRISGVEDLVPRKVGPRTMSGGEPSSIKRNPICAVGLPFLS